LKQTHKVLIHTNVKEGRENTFEGESLRYWYHYLKPKAFCRVDHLAATGVTLRYECAKLKEERKL